jgi:hypothetical protein
VVQRDTITIITYIEIDDVYQEVAKLNVYRHHIPFPFKTPAYEVSIIVTHEQYRGLGLAKALYDLFFRYIGKVLIAGDMQTPGGRRNWISMFNSDNLVVSGLVGVPDRLFQHAQSHDLEDKFLQRHLNDLMQLGPEYLGSRGVSAERIHWFRVPVQHNKDRIDFLMRSSLIPLYAQREAELVTTLYATQA